MNSLPGLSIVIPTEGRALLTVQLLEKLADQRSQVNVLTEVLVVDSSHDSDRNLILAACQRFGAVLIDGSSSVRKKRNLGVIQARYSIILFLDSDCFPADDLINQHWKSYEQSGETRLGGVLGRLEFVGPKAFAWKLVQHSSLVKQFDIASAAKDVRWGPTANLSIRRDVLDEIGLFDENFPFKLGGDDLDLTYRLTEKGYRLACNPNAVAYHDRSTWNHLRAVLGRALRWGKMEYYLYKKHVSLRTPHPPTVFGWEILILIFSIINCVIFRSLLFMALPLSWLLLALLFFSTLAAASCQGSWEKKWISFKESLLTAIPELVYQLGSTIEFLRHADLRFLYSRPLLSSGGAKDIWLPEAWNTWSNMLALFVCYTFLLYLV